MVVWGTRSVKTSASETHATCRGISRPSRCPNLDIVASENDHCPTTQAMVIDSQCGSFYWHRISGPRIPLTRLKKTAAAVDFRSPERLSDNRTMSYGSLSHRKERGIDEIHLVAEEACQAANT